MSDDAEPDAEESAADETPDADLADTETVDRKKGVDGPPKKRWFDRGLVWLAVVLVIAVVALVVSFRGSKKEDLQSAADAPAPQNTLAFCSAARALAEAPAPSVAVGDATAYIAYKRYVVALREAAPPSIASRLQNIEDSFQPVIDAMQAPGGQGPEAMTAIGQALDAQSDATAADSEVLSDYIERVCGFNMAQAAADVATSSTTTPIGPDGATQPTIIDPDDPSSTLDPTATTTPPGSDGSATTSSTVAD